LRDTFWRLKHYLIISDRFLTRRLLTEKNLSTPLKGCMFIYWNLSFQAYRQKKVTCDNSVTSFMSLCKIWSAMDLGESFSSDVVKLNDNNYYKESSLVTKCVISELHLKAEKIAQEANAAITLMEQDEDISLPGLLTIGYVATDWDNVELTGAEKKIIARALDHPSEIIAKSAAKIIVTRAGGDETAEEIKGILSTGRDSALYHISQIATNVWREKAPEIILHRLAGELTDGCQYLLEKLPKISSDQYDGRICAMLRNELTNPNVEIAIGAAKGYANHHPAQAHVRELKNILAYWKKNEEPYPVKSGTVPPSPRKKLVQVIDQLNGFTVSELVELCSDPRKDVKDAARDALLRLCKSEESALNNVIDLIQQERASINILAKLIELPAEILQSTEKQILALLDSPLPELRAETLKMLHGGWLADETAMELAEKFLDDPDVHVRNQAVATLRELESYEPA
jgi:hypothetical protein